MPRVPALSKHKKIYREAAPPGCMGGMLNMFQWNSAVLGGKKLLTDLDFPDGLEAPRNSLDTVSGGSGISDTPKSSSVTKVDIPFGFKITKPVIPAKEHASESKGLRSPSIIARLMGLDALPDAASAATMSELQSLHVKNQKQRLSVTDKLLTDINVRPQLSDQARTLELKTAGKAISKNVHRGDVDRCYQKYPCDTPAREEHPQERQLQELKKQFASRLALQSHEIRRRQQSESLNREVLVKRVMVQEKMNEANAVLAGGDKNDPKRLTAALKKLDKCKEFQEVLEVLQSNEEFFLKFLQDPKSMLLDKRLQEPVPEEGTYTPPPPIETRTGKGGFESTGYSAEKKKKGGICPSAFAWRFLESRREGKEQKRKWKSQEQGSKSQTETEENTPISTPRTSTSLLPRFRGRFKSRSVEMEKGLAVPTISKEESFSVNSYKVDPFSPGSIILPQPGSTDSTAVNSPFSALSYSPRLSRSGNESTSKGRQTTERAKEYEYEHGDMTRRSDKNRLGDWDYVFPIEANTRDAREGTRHRGKHDKYEGVRSKEPRDIARSVIREGRRSAREFTKFEHLSVGEARLSATESASRRVAQSPMGCDIGGVSGSSEGEITPCSTSRLSTFSQDCHCRSHFGMSSISRAVAAHFSPQASPDLANNSQISVDQMQQSPMKSAPDINNLQSASHRSRSTTSSCQISSKVLRKDIAGSLQENQNLASRDSQQYDSISLLPLHLSGETMTSMSQSEEDIAANSLRTLSSGLSLSRCRSVPNAALVRGTRSRGEQPQSNTDSCGAGTSSPAQLEYVVSGGKQFADSDKRGVEAVGSLFARAKSKERNKIFVRIRKKPEVPVANEPKSVLSLKSTGQESMSVNCSSSHISCLGATSEDFAGSEFDVSNVSPKDWGGVLATNDSEPEAGEMKRIPFVSDAMLSFEREQPDLPQECVEQQLPETPTSLPRCVQQVWVHGDVDPDRRISVTDSLSTTESLEVSVGDQLSRTLKIRSIARDAPREQDEEALEMAVDKGGHPSPISVLDSPFQADISSPAESNEIDLDLQELCLRLRLLKLDGNDRSRLTLDCTQGFSDVEAQVVHRMLVEKDSNNFKRWTGCQLSCTVHSSKTSPARSTPTAAEVAVSPPAASDVCHGQRTWLESIDLEGFSHPQDSKEDLVYVRNLLVASEFVESSTKVFARWYSPNHPLDPILFKNLEEYYNQDICKPQFVTVNEQIRRNRMSDTQPRHRMLFDAVDEVLLRKLGPYLTFPWVKPSTPLLRPIPVGRVLVWETWMELCDFFPSCRADASSFLLDRELGSGPEWVGIRETFEEFGLELEKNIFDDLICEAVQALIQIKDL